MLFISVLTSRGHSRALVIAILSPELSQQRECKLHIFLGLVDIWSFLKQHISHLKQNCCELEDMNGKRMIQVEEEKSNQCAGDREQREKVKANWEGRDRYIC